MVYSLAQTVLVERQQVGKDDRTRRDSSTENEGVVHKHEMANGGNVEGFMAAARMSLDMLRLRTS